jgi:hypothetical protein
MRPRGKPVGVHQVLGEAEQAAVRQAVLDYRPCDVGLSGQLWTRRLVGELIAKLYRARLTEPGVGRYLKRWGLSFQRPDKRAVEQNPEAVRLWHAETWPAIRAGARKDGGEVLFADQVGIRSDQVTGRTWGERGRTPGVRRSGGDLLIQICADDALVLPVAAAALLDQAGDRIRAGRRSARGRTVAGPLRRAGKGRPCAPVGADPDRHGAVARRPAHQSRVGPRGERADGLTEFGE